MAGSNVLFEMLLNNLLEKKLVGIVRFNRNQAAPARLAALVPQEEQVQDANTSGGSMQIEPPGFYLILLPFAEDIRCDPVGNNNICTFTRINLYD